jgi:hypothetical protein
MLADPPWSVDLYTAMRVALDVPEAALSIRDQRADGAVTPAILVE